MSCKQCQDTGEVNAWDSSGEWVTEDCPACAVPAVYTVHEVTISAGHVHFEVRNGRTGHVAMSTSDRANADLDARYRNLYDAPMEADADWTPGTRTNWWARNGSEAA